MVRSNGNSWHSWPCSTASTDRVYVSKGTTASPCDSTDRNSLLQQQQQRFVKRSKKKKKTQWETASQTVCWEERGG